MRSNSLRMALVLAFLAACSSSSTDPPGSSGSGGTADKPAVVKNYAAVVRANYDDALAQMKLLQKAVDAFVATPSQATMEAAKAAWVAARPSYIQSEAFRFYNGPIDNETTGTEGMINGWPIDENYIDYVVGEAESGIINKKKADATFEFPAITKEIILEQNEKGGEKNLSTGWHAIEFLLWGQDIGADGKPNNAGTGVRPYTDFTNGGTAKNQDRRRTYLKVATDLMVEQFAAIAAQWNPAPGTYATKMIEGDPDAALGNMLKGIGSLAGTELPKERMNNAYETKEQEEEHSCFSDTTSADLINNAQGIENVYLGKYGATTGASISDLVKAKDPALDTKMRADLTAALDATKAIPKPFDTAIVDEGGGRAKVKASIDSWAAVTSDIVAVSTALGVTINLSEE
jgi:putative iron-regulated protein